MQVPAPLIRVGVSYRVHPPDGPALIGTVKRKKHFQRRRYSLLVISYPRYTETAGLDA